MTLCNKLLTVFSKTMKVSLFKTIRFNCHYFGLKSIFRPVVICSKNLLIKRLSGSVKVKEFNKIGAIRLGFADVEVIDRKYCRSIWLNNGEVVFNGCAHFAAGSKIINEGKLIIGNHVIVNGDTAFIVHKQVSIGDDTLFSWGCEVTDTDFHPVFYLGSKSQLNHDSEVIIGNNCWICSGSIILKGVSVQDNTIIAAGSVITKTINNGNCIYGGNNKLLRKNTAWDYE